MQIRRRTIRFGFSLVELLMAMMVTVILLTALVTLASAFGDAHEASSEMAEEQTVLRTATIRVLDAIRFSNRVISATATQIQLWFDTDADGKIEAGEYQTLTNNGTSLSITGNSGTVTVIPVCQNLQFSVDAAAPTTKRICIAFDLEENGQWRHYEIGGSLWASSGHVH
jgi:prepilin-type N-terminal cleavage/methylation domain-containing protein